MPLFMRPSSDPHDTMNTSSAARCRQVIAVAVTCLLIVWCTAAIARDSILASQAAQHVGEMATVCGVVASARYVPTSKARLAFVRLGTR